MCPSRYLCHLAPKTIICQELIESFSFDYQSSVKTVNQGMSDLCLVDISRAFSRFPNTCSMEGLCCFIPVHVKASLSTNSKASSENFPLSLGSANSIIFPPLVSDLALYTEMGKDD